MGIKVVVSGIILRYMGCVLLSQNTKTYRLAKHYRTRTDGQESMAPAVTAAAT